MDREQNQQDEIIVVRCLLGERGAFDALVERWHPCLWRYVQCMVEKVDHAEEAAQETWVRILRGLPSLREPQRFEAWAFGIARRVLMDRLRARYAGEMEELEPTATAADVETKAFDAEDKRRLRDVMRHMPLLEREVLVLHYMEGLPLAIVAGIAGVPVGTVKSRLHRGRGILRTTMTGTGATP